jgi:hypothetical protein
MKINKEQVDQFFYEEFEDYCEIKMATMTKWFNGEGIDVSITRKNLSDINVSLTWDDCTLLRRMFVDSEI